MVGVVTADVSDAGELVEVAAEAIASVEVGAVAEADPGAAQDVVVQPVDGWQREVVVERIRLEPLHDGQDGDTVAPDVPGDVEHFLPVDEAAIQVNRRGGGELVQVGVRCLLLGNLSHLKRLLMGDQTQPLSNLGLSFSNLSCQSNSFFLLFQKINTIINEKHLT